MIFFVVNKRSKSRIVNLEKCLIMFEQLEARIDYCPENVFCLIEEVSKDISLSFLNAFVDNGENISLSDKWTKSILGSKFNDCFKSEEIGILLSFGKTFGTTDCRGQIKNCILHKQLIRNVYAREVEKSGKRGNLITTLGLIASIGIIVIFV